MILFNFCDEYLIAEYLRLKAVLSNMPRFSTGYHNGLKVIRTYWGHGKRIIKQEACINSPKTDSIEKKYKEYITTQNAYAQFKEELKRRNILIPGGFKLISTPSPYNAGLWDQFIDCSNPHEVKTEYYDDYGYNVRSRGEMNVGNALKALGLEAKYEPDLILSDSRKRSPDYSFPIRVLDRCFFVEFIGQADNIDYLNANYGKFDEYMRNGIFPNRDLIHICGTGNGSRPRNPSCE